MPEHSALRGFEVDDLRLLAMVSDAGSINAASRTSGISKSVLSRAVGKLEEMTGGPLFDRTPTGMTLTATGAVLLPVARRAAQVVRDADEALRSASDVPQGPLRIAASALSGSQLVAPALAEMARLHPKVETTLRVTARGPDPLAEDLDLVLQIGKPEGTHVVSRRIVASPLALYAAREQAARTDLSDPEAVSRLGRVVVAIENVPSVWDLEYRDGRRLRLDTPPLLRIGDPTVAIAVLNAGAGVAMIPWIYGEPLARAGALVRVLPDWLGPTMEVHGVMPPRRAAIPAVATFLDILRQHAERLRRAAETG